LSLPLVPSDGDVERALADIAASQRRAIILTRRAHVYPEQAKAIDALLTRVPDALVVSVREPFDLPLLSRARHVLAQYSDDAPSIAGLADVIFGSSFPDGTLPVPLPSHV